MKSGFDKLGKEVSAMGIGCWAIGGQNYGEVNDDESIRAVRRALELGINLFDTANVYGAGHSEQIIGRALAGHRNEVCIATKFGYTFDEKTKNIDGMRWDKEYIETACEDSLRRLGTDYIDLYQLHLGALEGEAVDEVIGALESLVNKGKIRTFGWSTDVAANAERFAKLEHCAAIQYQLNLFYDNPELLRISEQYNITGLIRAPLAMGTLSGKYNSGTKVAANDVRGGEIEWVPYFKNGQMQSEFVEKLDAAREILTSGGRTLAQGALAWVWGKSDKIIPIPGFRTVKQVEENVKAMDFGALTSAQMQELNTLIPPLQWRQY